MIEELKEKLKEIEISYYEKDGGIAVAIPFNFGEFEFHELPENDDILLLADEDWHTHSSIENGIDGIAKIIKDVLENKYLLIKEVSSVGEEKRRIEADLNEYLRWLPEGYSYDICNKA